MNIETASGKSGAKERRYVGAACILWGATYVLERGVPFHADIMLWLARGATALMWAWAAMILHRNSRARSALASPAFLLGSFAFWFYAVAPEALNPLNKTTEGLYIVDPWSIQVILSQAVEFKNVGAWMVVRFVLLMLAVAVLVSMRRLSEADESRQLPPPGRALTLIVGLGAGAVAAAKKYDLVELVDIVPGEIARNIYFGCPVLVSLAIAMATIRYLARERHAAMDGFLLMVSAWVLLPNASMKMVFFSTCAILVTLMGSSRIPKKYIFLAVTALFILVITTFMIRPNAPAHRDSILDTFLQFSLAKMVFRQWETMLCLSSVAHQHAEDSNLAGGIEDVIAGLVPRFLWQDKPRPSDMGQIIILYCPSTLGREIHPQQSNSATLLGPPMILGGWPMLAATQGFLLLVLGYLSRVWNTGSPLSASVILGLAPSLIDFDQHISLYVAILVKAGIIAIIAATAPVLWRKLRIPHS